MYIMCLDIGGTNPYISIVQNETIIDKKLLTFSIPIFKQIKSYLEKHKNKNIKIGITAFAGEIQNNICYKATNVPFLIDGNKLKKKLNFKHFKIINDFEALGYAIINIHENQNEIKILFNKNNINLKKNKAIIGAGTGLGVCYIPFNKNTKSYDVIASEGGSGGFSPRIFIKLYSFIQKKYNKEQISKEEFVSGKGILNIMDYLLHSSKNVKEILSKRPYFSINETISDKEIIKVINKSKAQEFISSISLKNQKAHITMRLFMEFLGYCAQDVVLNGLSNGGLYIGGGIVLKNLNLFSLGDFKKSFYDNIHQDAKEILKKIPIYLIKNPSISLIGCSFYAKKNNLI